MVLNATIFVEVFLEVAAFVAGGAAVAVVVVAVVVKEVQSRVLYYDIQKEFHIRYLHLKEEMKRDHRNVFSKSMEGKDYQKDHRLRHYFCDKEGKMDNWENHGKVDDRKNLFYLNSHYDHHLEVRENVLNYKDKRKKDLNGNSHKRVF